MKAVVHIGYGSADVLEFKEIDKAVANDDDVFVRVHAASLAAAARRWTDGFGPLRTHEPETHESNSVHGLRTTGCSSTQRCAETRSEGQRGAGSNPRHDGQRGRLRTAEIRLRPLDLAAHEVVVRHSQTKTTRARARTCRGRRVGRQRCQ